MTAIVRIQATHIPEGTKVRIVEKISPDHVRIRQLVDTTDYVEFHPYKNNPIEVIIEEY